MKQIVQIFLLLATIQYSAIAMDQEHYQREQAAKRETLAKAAEARLNPQARQPEEYTITSLAGLPIELQKQIALQVLTNSPTLKNVLKNLFTLARSNKQLFDLLTNESFLNQVKKIIQQRNLQAELNSLLIYYSKMGNVYAVKLILKLGADVDAVDKNGDNALIFAAMNGHTEIVRILLNAKADVNAAGNFGLTALMLAVIKEHKETIKVLLDAGADPNIADKSGWTAFMFAAGKGNADIARLLLDAQPNP